MNHSDLVDTDVSHAVVVVQVGEGVDVEEGSRVDGGVEHESEVTVPIAIDVLRTSDGSTSLLNVGSLVRHRIVGHREINERHHGALVLLEIIVIEEVEVLGERGFPDQGYLV